MMIAILKVRSIDGATNALLNNDVNSVSVSKKGTIEEDVEVEVALSDTNDNAGSDTIVVLV